MQSVDQPVSDVLLADQGLRVGEKYECRPWGPESSPSPFHRKVYNFCHLISIAHIVSRMYFSPENSRPVRRYITQILFIYNMTDIAGMTLVPDQPIRFRKRKTAATACLALTSSIWVF